MILTEMVPKGNMETLLHDEKINLPLPLRMRSMFFVFMYDYALF